MNIYFIVLTIIICFSSLTKWIMEIYSIATVVKAVKQDFENSEYNSTLPNITIERIPHNSLELPRIVFYSIYMGEVKYTHFPLLLESMRRNPRVQFNLIHINMNKSASDSIIALGRDLGVSNFFVKAISIAEFREIVKNRLGIDVPFTMEWYYKLCDYKPTLAHLFPELASNTTYKFWGYGDLDVIWGNFNEFAHWFQGDYQFIISGWWGSTGAAAFYPNARWSTRLFMQDELYIPLLRNKSYHNLDEGGIQSRQEHVIHNGRHSISEIQRRVMQSHKNFRMNQGKHDNDHCFIDPADSEEWAGSVEWIQGSLRIINESKYFPAGRKLLFYHCRRQCMIDFPKDIEQTLFRDMRSYGYLLPSWRPLKSRFVCNEESNSMTQFQPSRDCRK